MVYVGKNEYKYGRMIMSHMSSPNIEELHRMADRLSLNRKWFQNENKLHPHYDISKGFKAKAIRYGAKEVSDRELIRRCYPKLIKMMKIKFYCGDVEDGENEQCSYQCEGCNNAKGVIY